MEKLVAIVGRSALNYLLCEGETPADFTMFPCGACGEIVALAPNDTFKAKHGGHVVCRACAAKLPERFRVAKAAAK